MSDEFKAVAGLKFEVEGDRPVVEFLDQFGAKVRKVEGSTKDLAKALAQTGSAISSFAGKAQSQLQAFAGKELGGSIGSQARGVLQLRDAINQLAVTSGGGNEMMAGLKAQIQQVSVASNQLQGDVTSALQAFVEKTGDLKTARDNIAEYGKVATATSAALSDVAQVGVELKEKLNITDQAKAFAILATLSKSGSIELKDFARQAPRIFNVAGSAGVTGEEGLRKIGSLSEVYGKYVGGSGADKAARVATSIENTFASIAKKAPRLEAAGIKVEGRDRFDVLFDIIRKTGGNETQLRQVFTQQAMRGVLGLANEFKTTGRFGDFERFRTMAADAGIIDKDFATRTSTGESKLKSSAISRQRFIDQYFGGIAEFASGHANELDLGLRGLGGVGKGLSFAGSILGGKFGGGISSTFAQRVQVVNWPAGIEGAGGAQLTGAIGKLSAVLGAGALGYAIGTYLDNKYHLSDKLSGTKEGQIRENTNASDESPEQRGNRELSVAKGLAKQVASGKLDKRTAARQFRAFARGMEHIGKDGSDSALSGYALKIIDDLFGGDLGEIQNSTEARAGRESLKSYRSKSIGAVESLVGSGIEFGPTAIPATAPGGILGGFTEVLAKNFQPSFTININGNEVTVDGGTGTRAPKVLVRRGVEP